MWPNIKFPRFLGEPFRCLLQLLSAVVALSSRSPEEASSRGSESKDPRKEAEEPRAELTDVEDRSEAGGWQGLNA